MKKTMAILGALLLAGLFICCTGKPTESTGMPDTSEDVQVDTDNTEDTQQEEAADEAESSPSEEQAYTPRHYITREMEIEKTLRNVTESDSAYIVDWLNANEALSAYYPSDCVYEPAGRVVVDDEMYYFIYVSSNMTDSSGTKSMQVIAELLLAMDYSEAYECWWLTDKLLIYDNEELLAG